MRKLLSPLSAFSAFVLMLLPGAAAAPATNPLIWADVPDNAIVRVGDTYYMSSTTMHMSPGVPVRAALLHVGPAGEFGDDVCLLGCEMTVGQG